MEEAVDREVTRHERVSADAANVLHERLLPIVDREPVDVPSLVRSRSLPDVPPPVVVEPGRLQAVRAKVRA